MKKNYSILFILLLIVIPLNVNATGGGLKKNSIKTCPNGITYGLHSDGNGGTHWHKAATNGKNYYADGDAIMSDPCPNSTENKGTAESTGQNNNSSSNNNTTSNNNNSSPTTINKPIIQEKPKSNDVSLKSVIIEDENIVISDNMLYETTKKNVEINITPNDNKTKIIFTNEELKDGDNLININVVAENGDKKEYKLIITKIKEVGTATIKKFILGADEVNFENNKATIQKLSNETSLEYSYQLSHYDANLVIYHNDQKIEKLENLKDGDILKLVVIDKNENENIYEIQITDASPIYTFIIYGIATLIMFAPIIGIVIFIIYKKRKKQTK